MTTVDILVVGAHPDDAEVGVGGLIHKMVTQGYSVGILDLTEGELA
ncbi:MAG TPA: PIG-L family deacetylase, partial [Candidatus Hydrogenedentes bacterium]|nr:PIG-L family deacetylase [Candidatus Hydrogenedentota bacterium]